MPTQTLLGPFRQLLPLSDLPLKGPLSDDQLQVIEEAGILVDGETIRAIGNYAQMRLRYPAASLEVYEQDLVVLPGFIDCHTHICFGGSRARDYALRIAGTSYQEILRQGGGIHDSVQKTREASLEQLAESTAGRANRHLQEGVTTIEVKSGYGLSIDEELKMLRAIRQAQAHTPASLIPTCLAAHVVPKEAKSAEDWLKHVLLELLPQIKAEGLAQRVDIFIEEAFGARIALHYLQAAQKA
ncbi:imidazolonepropionase-like domain-containing protein, partial [Cesiribacter andamanensis]|uniref:imidazolonepropionase-like domain-containing protein n=1 Tax=Cesiribacter andamanensis TaxID=649507 RepID=UPI00058E728C